MRVSHDGAPGSPARVVAGDDPGAPDHRAYWEDFYRHRSGAVPPDPSEFARWVADREDPGAALVDVGCGTGRDSLWFSRSGFRCIGLDFARPAVEAAQAAARRAGLDARFHHANLRDPSSVQRIIERVTTSGPPDLLYARFFIHAVDDDIRQNLWSLAESVLPGGGRLYAEFRTEPTVHEFGEHYRHFVPSGVIVDELQVRGWEVVERLEGRGLAVYRHEDPVVCRLVARRGGSHQ